MSRAGSTGWLAHHCARGEDDRPVVSRRHAPTLAAEIELEAPLIERTPLLAILRRLVSPLLAGGGDRPGGIADPDSGYRC